MTRVLIIGGTGFIGRHIAGALSAAGHEVTAAGHRDIDLARDDEDALRAKLAGAEAVINCAGLVRDRRGASMAAVQGQGAARLFQAALAAGVRRLIHISALGASLAGETAYQRTKGAAEDALRQIDPDGKRLDWCILRPSVVIGRGGASTAMLAALAALPFLPRLGDGRWQVQPVHAADLAALAVRLIESPAPLPRSLDAVGPEPMNTDRLLTALRTWLGLPSARFIAVPEPLLMLTAAIGEKLADGPVNREVVAMLKRGNVADAAPMAAALGRPPMRLSHALALHPASQADRWHARLFLLRPVLRWSLGLLWVATALLSFGLYPVDNSTRLLGELGVSGLPASILLYGAASLDLLLGLLLLARIRPVAVGAAQLATMAAFSLAALGLPAEYWLHPFAPLLKNLPLAAATLVMMALEAKP